MLGIMNKDQFGINMKKYCKEHEQMMRQALSDKCVSEDFIRIHKEKISIVQHERLVHLIVTFMVTMIESFVVYLVFVHPELGIVPAIIMLGLLILLGFYYYHYFFLENTLQRWYKILDEMEHML